MDLNLLYTPNLLVALVGAAGVFIIFLSLVRSPRLRGLRKIIAGETAEPEPQAPTYRERLQARLDQADLGVGASEFLQIAGVSAGVAGVAGWLVLGVPAAGAVLALLAVLLYWTYLEDRRDKRRQEYQEALPDVVDMIRASFGAGSGVSLAVAFEHVVEYGPPIVRPDFAEMSTRLRGGENLAVVLRSVGQRRRDVILDMIIETLVVHETTGGGGEISGVLQRLAEAVRALVRIRRRVRAEQMKVTWEGRIMCLAPFVFLALIQVTAPAYSRSFFGSALGQLAILVAGALSLGAYFMMRRIANRVLTLLERREYPSLFEDEPAPTAAPVVATPYVAA